MQYIIDLINNNDIVRLIFELVLISILGGIIGWERESWSKPAGLKTHVLLGISAVLVAFMGREVAKGDGHVDQTRIAAQLLSGIGFLGAGTIFRNGYFVKGLTTATSLLAITCIGMCVGFGLYLVAIISTVFVYIILKDSHYLSERLAKSNSVNYQIYCEKPKKTLEEIKAIFVENHIDIIKVNIKNNEEEKYIDIKGKMHVEFDKNAMLTRLMYLDNVISVSDINEDDED